MKETITIIKLSKCNWCGTEFIKKHNGQVYCSEYCKKDARLEKNREYRLKYYHNNKNILNEEQRWGLERGYLGMHRNNDFNKEYLSIKTEMKRPKLKA